MYAERLKKIRKNVDLKADEMAVALDVKPRTYGSYERGENMLPIEIATKICNIFNVSGTYLLTGKGDMFNAAQNEPNNDELAQRVRQILREEGVIK